MSATSDTDVSKPSHVSGINAQRKAAAVMAAGTDATHGITATLNSHSDFAIRSSRQTSWVTYQTLVSTPAVTVPAAIPVSPYRRTHQSERHKLSTASATDIHTTPLILPVPMTTIAAVCMSTR